MQFEWAARRNVRQFIDGWVGVDKRVATVVICSKLIYVFFQTLLYEKARAVSIISLNTHIALVFSNYKVVQI